MVSALQCNRGHGISQKIAAAAVCPSESKPNKRTCEYLTYATKPGKQPTVAVALLKLDVMCAQVSGTLALADWCS